MVDAVQVVYAPLPVLDVDASLAPDAPRIHADLADNILFHRRFGEGDVDSALAEADLVIEQTFTFPRQTAIPIEARGVIAAFDAASNRFTIWSSTQSPHQARLIFAHVLGVPEGDVRVIAPDIGGSFGIKGAATRKRWWSRFWPGACTSRSSGSKTAEKTSWRARTPMSRRYR